MIKVFKISKVAIGSEEGLLDSGATHSLQSRRRCFQAEADRSDFGLREDYGAGGGGVGRRWQMTRR